MTPDPQLLTKQVIGIDLDAVGRTFDVRFNLQRGKIARIWGALYGLVGVPAGGQEWSAFLRKTPSSDRATTPSDNLFTWLESIATNGAGWANLHRERYYTLPKPHRTFGVTVQMHCSVTTTTSGIMIIYYDIDDAMKGELTQSWEKSRTVKYGRRALSP